MASNVTPTARATIPRQAKRDATDATVEDAQAARAARSRRASAPLVPDEPRYAIGKVLGTGGMGEVIAAHDQHIGRDVAIKRLHGTTPSAAARARFFREARIQGRLEHPAIPPVHEIARDEHGPYFVMRKLEGVTLAAALRDAKPPFTRQRLLRAFVEVCHAIDLAHSRRIVHRDLKPANILLGPRGEVYVLDWGIARELDAPDAFAGGVSGTPGYMAPEQARGATDLDERVDIYALGCILYEILTRVPLHRRAESLDLPHELDVAYRRATAANRSDRFASVRELGDVVQAFLDGDRDLEQRHALARQHLAAARAALTEIADDETRRSVVMHEAGKALALDPSIDGAAELIGRLMLEAPATPPAAAARELAALDEHGATRMMRFAFWITVVYLLVLVAFIAAGIRDVPYLAAYGGVAAAMSLVTLVGRRYPHAALGVVFKVLMVAMVGVLARMFTPVLVAPAVAVVVVGSTVFNPLLQRRHVVGLTLGASLALAGVWLAELAGLVSRTMWLDGATLHLRLPVDGIERFPVLAGLAFAAVTCMTVAAAASWSAMREIRAARERLAVQAWHLRQLV